MRTLRLLAATAAFAVVCAGCASAPVGPTGPGPVPNTVRAEMGRLAIRGPTMPSIHLTTALESKGSAAGKTAASAGLGWLGGSFRAAGETGDPMAAGLVAAFGLVTTPVVAVGGALYGAAAADSEEAVARGNAVILQALAFTPDHFKRILEASFDDGIEVQHEFVPAGSTNARLRSQGFDSVMDVRMVSITSLPDPGGLEVRFEVENTVSLTSLDDGRELERRTYGGRTTDRNVSEWSRKQSEPLHAALAGVLTDTAEEIADAFFLAPAIRVRGMEPVSRQRFGTGRISGTRPMFVWSALDGGNAVAGAGVEYELVIEAGGAPSPAVVRTPATRYVPQVPLRSCERYEWKVRAHYVSFDRPTASPWSPTYRFKTPCQRRAL